jgi:hypothetical protein
MTNLTLLTAKEALERLVRLPIPVKDAYRLATLIRELEEELIAFDKAREAIVTKNGADNRPANERDIGELLRLPIEREIEPVTIPFPDGELSANDIICLLPFVVFEDDSEKGD